MCAAPANQSTTFYCPGFQHAVVLTGLSFATTYYYQIGGVVSGSTETIWSEVYQFTSHPGVGPNVPASSIVYGDLGVYLPYDEVTMSKQKHSFNSPALFNCECPC